MRVCHLIKSLGRGGAESLLPWLIAAGGEDASFAVGYFVPHKNQLVREIESVGARVQCFGGESAAAILLRVREVARWLRDERADVLHCHLPVAGIVGRLAGRLARVPVVYTEHNLLERYHPATRWLGLLTWGLQSEVVAVSSEVASSIARHAGDRVPVRVVRNGIPFKPLAQQSAATLRESLGIAADAPVVGTVAVFRKQKRLDLWLNAAAEVRRSLPAARFVLVGDGALRRELEERTAALGLQSAVLFTGLQPEVQPYLAMMDVYLSSSEFEGLPIAVLEAMASGVPVVGTAVGGVPEAVADGDCGFLLPFGDVPGLASAVVQLLLDDDRRRTMGRAAQVTVTDRFDIARMAGELEALYRETIDGYRGR